MKNVGVVGIGDMGSGLAKNLIAAGFPTKGFDLSPNRMAAFVEMGGVAASSPSDVADGADAVFVMVMTGDQAKEVIFGENGVAKTMKDGVIILTATIKPTEAREIGEALAGSGVTLIDSPVSGGFPGAQNGTLTMMAAAPAETLEAARPIMEAVSASIHHVGAAAGDGQTMKSCLQALLGSMFAATFEAAALAAKAGVSGEAFFNVVNSSSGGCGVTSSSLSNIIDRKFEGTGSHIATMHKDLTISLAFAQELGVPMHSAATAMQIFHAGKTKYPNGDNWVCTRVIEEIIGAELHR